jgi:hypothetical protein
MRERAERLAPDNAPEDKPEEIKLYLPSQLPTQVPCSERLYTFEWQLRHLQAHNALNELRNHLRLCSHLWMHKNRFERGQRPNTRARNVIERCNSRIAAAAKKYIAACAALVVLAHRTNKVGWEEELKVLDPAKHCRALEDDADDPVSGNGSKRLNEGSQARSWIWQTPGMAIDGEGGLHDGRPISLLSGNPCLLLL